MQIDFDPDRWEFEDTQAAIVTYKKPFLDWLNRENAKTYHPELLKQFKEDNSLEKLNEEPTVFLVPDFEDPWEVKEWINQRKKKLFAFMLNAWYRDPTCWPQFSKQLFDLWFEIKITYSVVDVELQEELEDHPWED